MERAHQALADALRMCKLEEQELNPKVTFEEILTGAVSTTCSMHHTALKATPAQSVFGQDMIPSIMMEANWERMCQCRQEVTALNDVKENDSRIPHVHKVGGKVMHSEHGELCKLSAPQRGLHKVQQVHNDGMLHICQCGAVSERLNICHSTPFIED